MYTTSPSLPWWEWKLPHKGLLGQQPLFFPPSGTPSLFMWGGKWLFFRLIELWSWVKASPGHIYRWSDARNWGFMNSQAAFFPTWPFWPGLGWDEVPIFPSLHPLSCLSLWFPKAVRNDPRLQWQVHTRSAQKQDPFLPSFLLPLLHPLLWKETQDRGEKT